MPTIEDLLLEKRRYGLEEIVTDKEKEMLHNNMPIQKIIGYIESDNVTIYLNRKVLIPRYETMEMVDFIKNNFIQNDMKILDLCCGSGYIALALKKFNRTLQVYASDISREAVISTNENALKNNLKINVIQSDLFKNLKGHKFDLIISNPPYLDYGDKLDKSVLDYEPHDALFAKDHGWYFYEKILKNYKNFMKKEGILIFEINPIHSKIWQKMANIKIIKDINNKDRFVIIK